MEHIIWKIFCWKIVDKNHFSYNFMSFNESGKYCPFLSDTFFFNMFFPCIFLTFWEDNDSDQYPALENYLVFVCWQLSSTWLRFSCDPLLLHLQSSTEHVVQSEESALQGECSTREGSDGFHVFFLTSLQLCNPQLRTYKLMFCLICQLTIPPCRFPSILETKSNFSGQIDMENVL